MRDLFKRTAILLSVALVVPLCGCATHGGKIAYDPANFGASDPVPLALRSADYHLGHGDVITLRVYKVDTVPGDQTFDAGGSTCRSLVRCRLAG